MEKVVLFCRTSTQAQDYQYQVEMLTEIANQRGWEIAHVIANKISGAKKNEERPEVQELLRVIHEENISRVACTEISRLGRSTLEALKTIEMLNERGISLYLANYGLETLDKDGKVNPVTSLITTILLEVAQMERGMIRSRMEMGYREYLNRRRTEDLPLGRPQYSVKTAAQYKEEYPKEVALLRKGISLRNVSSITGTAVGTLRRIKKCL